MSDRATTLVVGAGVIGSALAMHLAEMGDPGVVCVDPDLAGERSSSELNAGGVRATWWRPVNIDLCARTIGFLADHAGEVGFRRNGYLWLYGPELWSGALGHVDLQNRFGRRVEVLSPRELGDRWPFVDRLEGIAGATFSPLDGLVDPHAVRELYRSRARAAGARFVDRRLLVGLTRRRAGAMSARLLRLRDRSSALERLVEPLPPGDGSAEIGVVECERVVNAAGPWASRVARALGYAVPSRAVRRQVSVVACRDVDLSGHGMIVDTTGCYFHHEAGDLVLAGYSPPRDPPGYGFDYEGRAFFEAEIWPRLAARSTGFDRLEHVRGWAGLYELSPDNSALLGAVEGAPGTFEIHSFSGRGVMQSHAAALALAELMLTGSFQTADASALAGSRFETGALQTEDLHI